MKKPNVFLCFLLFLFFTSICQGARTRKPGTWCVANWFVSDEELKAYLDEKCQIPNVCRGIQPGKPCFEPNETHSHASYIL
ncbi:hypothetical protein P3L10_000647 [Capsicum annuum]